MSTKKLLTESFLFSNPKIILMESDKGPCKRMMARGQFGKCDIPTANGRIYKRYLWERELSKLENKINENEMLGELDHPCFIDDNFEVLTVNRGWQNFNDIQLNEEVWSNINGNAVVSIVDEIVNEQYNGLAVSFKGRNIDTCVTAPHRMLVAKRPDMYKSNKHSYVKASEILENKSKFAHSAIPKTAQFPLRVCETIDLVAENMSTIKIDAKLFCAFLGIYLSDGSFRKEDGGHNYSVFISQINEWSREFIYQEVLSKFPQEITWRIESDGFRVADKRLWNYVKLLGDSYTMHIPDFIKSLDSDCLKEIIFWFTIGDGRVTYAKADGPVKNHESYKHQFSKDLRDGNIQNVRSQVFTVSKRLIDDLHECLIKTGRCGSVSKVITDEDYIFAGRLIRAENKVPLYTLNISTTDYIWLDPRFMLIEPKEYDGQIFCLKVSNGNFYVRQNGKSFWTGNCDGVTKLQRVSHVITKVDIQPDGTIVGEAIIFPDTVNGKQLIGILNGGGKVGISSRGFGSTLPDDSGNEVVQEDFQLLTWDFVADPASAGSFPKFTNENKQNVGTQIIEDNMKPKVLIKEQFIEDKKDDKEIKNNENDKNNKEDNDSKKNDKNDDTDNADKGKEEDKGNEQNDVNISLNAEAIRKIKEDAYKEAIGRVQELIKEKEESLKEQIRSELMSDPKVANSNLALESIKKLLVPHLVDDDIKQEMAKRDAEVSGLKEQLKKVIDRNKELEGKVQEQNEKMKKQIGAIKELGYTLKSEKTMDEAKVFSSEKRNHVRKIVGDVCKYESIEKLDDVITEVLSKVDSDEINGNIILEHNMKEKEILIAEQNEIIESLRNKIAESEKIMAESVALAEKMSARAYLSERTANHPASERIKGIVEARGLIKKEDIDSICEQFSQLRTPGSMLREKIKKSLNVEQSSGASTLVEDHVMTTMPSDSNDDELVEGTGITVTQIKQLS